MGDNTTYPVMKGLWDLHTRCLKPGQDFIIWHWLATGAIIFATLLYIPSVPPSWKITRFFSAGLLVLSLYFFLHSVDLTIQQRSTAVTYSYIVLQTFNSACRTLSDIAILCGYYLVLKRYHTPVVTVGVEEGMFAYLLWSLGLYKMGLQFAVCFTWLGFADIKVIGAVAEAHSGFDVTFAAVYFVFTGLAMMARYESPDPGFTEKPLRYAYDPGAHQAANNLREMQKGASFAGWWLLIRGFCELVIAGHLVRSPVNVLGIYKARDICYSIFSWLFVCFMGFSTPLCLSNTAGRNEDPWDVDARARKREEERQQVQTDNAHALAQDSLDGWSTEADRRMKEALVTLTESGMKSAPDVSVVLKDLREKVQKEHESSATTDHRLLQGKLDHLKRMEESFGDWVPVFKWAGRSQKDDGA